MTKKEIIVLIFLSISEIVYSELFQQYWQAVKMLMLRFALRYVGIQLSKEQASFTMPWIQNSTLSHQPKMDYVLRWSLVGRASGWTKMRGSCTSSFNTSNTQIKMNSNINYILNPSMSAFRNWSIKESIISSYFIIEQLKGLHSILLIIYTKCVSNHKCKLQIYIIIC